MYRLHIDVPLGTNQVEAIALAKEIIHQSATQLASTHAIGLTMNYRLGNDEDRQKSNYLDIDSKGHCSNKKSSLKI